MEILTIHGRIPTKKNKYRVSRHGGLFKPKDVTDFERMFGKEVAAQRIGIVRGPSRVEIDLFVGTNEQDLDGAVTTILDCLQQAQVIENDKDVVVIQAQKDRSGREQAGARVTISRYEE